MAKRRKNAKVDLEKDEDTFTIEEARKMVLDFVRSKYHEYHLKSGK